MAFILLLRLPLYLLILCSLGLGLAAPSPQEAAHICRYARLPLDSTPKLDGLSAKLNQSRPITIVALGSSSTVGVGADYSYTRVLEQTLTQSFPRANFRVINRGVSGDNAEQMLARLERDVLSLQPDLVIWQLGTNSAIQRVDLAIFRVQVEQGIKQIRERGAILFLMDGQVYPGFGESPNYTAYQRVLSEIAHQNGLVLIPRFELMNQLLASGYAYADLLADDQFHPNTFMQSCIGHYIAQMIAQLVKKP